MSELRFCIRFEPGTVLRNDGPHRDEKDIIRAGTREWSYLRPKYKYRQSSTPQKVIQVEIEALALLRG